MKSISYFFKTYFLTLIVAVLILLLSVLSFDSVSESMTIKIPDKLVHAIMYFGMMFVLLFEESGYFKRQLSILCLIWSAIIVSLYGALMEFIQYFISYRSASLYDILANIGGVIFSLLCFLIISNVISNVRRK